MQDPEFVVEFLPQCQEELAVQVKALELSGDEQPLAKRMIQAETQRISASSNSVME